MKNYKILIPLLMMSVISTSMAYAVESVKTNDISIPTLNAGDVNMKIVPCMAVGPGGAGRVFQIQPEIGQCTSSIGEGITRPWIIETGSNPGLYCARVGGPEGELDAREVKINMSGSCPSNVRFKLYYFIPTTIPAHNADFFVRRAAGDIYEGNMTNQSSPSAAYILCSAPGSNCRNPRTYTAGDQLYLTFNYPF